MRCNYGTGYEGFFFQGSLRRMTLRRYEGQLKIVILGPKRHFSTQTFLPVCVAIRQRVGDESSGQQEEGPEQVNDAKGGQKDEGGTEGNTNLM